MARPNNRLQKRSWNTKEWKEKQSARVSGQICQQCGSADVLQVHHLNTEKQLYYLMRIRVIKQLIREKMQSGEIPFRGRISREFQCPNCAFKIRITNSRQKIKLCSQCGIKSPLTETNLTLQREYNYNLSRSEIILFTRKYENEIEAQLQAKSAPPKSDYMNLDQDTVILCKTCHFALENGHELCQICKKNYKKIGEAMCFNCLSDEEKRNFLQNQ